jgi:hypothetical protein
MLISLQEIDARLNEVLSEEDQAALEEELAGLSATPSTAPALQLPGVPVAQPEPTPELIQTEEEPHASEASTPVAAGKVAVAIEG